MKKFIKAAGAASILALVSAGNPAGAAILDEMGFAQHASFDDPTFYGGALQFKSATVNPDPLAPVGYTDFAWEGANDPAQSSIQLQAQTNTSVPTYSVNGIDPLRYNADFTVDGDGMWNAGDWWVISSLTQINNRLTSLGGTITDPLWVVDALANLDIYSDAARTNLIYDDATSTTNIAFNETFNSAPCDDNPLGTTCDDIFTVLSLAFDPVTFWYDGVQYQLEFGLIPGVSTAKTAADPNNPFAQVIGTSLIVQNEDGTINVYTPENNPGTSTVHVVMRWTPVPEPSVIGLFGAGLLVLSLAGRRRRQS